MAYKVNPLSFRLGISRMCKTSNNIYLSNYSFLWAEYFRYEKFLFLFFYKYKFWVVSSKLMFLTKSSLVIFCNYYRLRPYYNKKPVRKKKRAFYDPDGQLRSFRFMKYFDKLFFKRFILKYTKRLEYRANLKEYARVKHRNYRAAGYHCPFLKYTKKWVRRLRKTYFFFVNDNESGNNGKYAIVKKEPKHKYISSKEKTWRYASLIKKTFKQKNKQKILFLIKKTDWGKNIIRKKLVRIQKYFDTNISNMNINLQKKINNLKKSFKLNNFLFNKQVQKNSLYIKLFFKYIRQIEPKFMRGLSYIPNFKQKLIEPLSFYNQPITIPQQKNLRMHRKNFSYFNNYLNKEERKLFINNKFLKAYNYDIDEQIYSFERFKYALISDKLFFFHLTRLLKCIFFKKKLTLKLRNINNLIPYKIILWEDALRTAFLIQYKKKHFIRTIFRDFSYLNKIAYLEMDAQLFAKIIVNMFEMTKFHRRLIYLLKSVFGTLRRFYKHIDCKVKMKGKMQYKKRTKTIYIFKEVVIPLNRLFITVEYGKAPANTPFGVLGIKTWLYYKNFRYDTIQARKEEIIRRKDYLFGYGFEKDLSDYPELFKEKAVDWKTIAHRHQRKVLKAAEVCEKDEVERITLNNLRILQMKELNKKPKDRKPLSKRWKRIQLTNNEKKRVMHLKKSTFLKTNESIAKQFNLFNNYKGLKTTLKAKRLYIPFDKDNKKNIKKYKKYYVKKKN